MDVSCPQCSATYELDVSQIPGDSARVKCSSCGHVFRFYKPSALQEPPVFTSDRGAESSLSSDGSLRQHGQHGSSSSHHVTLSHPTSASQEWRLQAHAFTVRSENGVISHIPDQATLQRMIVERKVGPIDELSHDGEHWFRLGSLEEYQPFFHLLVQTSPSQHAIPGPVVLSSQPDATSTLEFGLPATYDPHQPLSSFQTSRPPEVKRHNTARYYEVISGSSSQDLPQPISSSSMSGEDLPFLSSPPSIYPPSGKLTGSHEDHVGTAAYGTSLPTSQATLPPLSPLQESPTTSPSVSSREKLEAIEASIHAQGLQTSDDPHDELAIAEPGLFFSQVDQRRIPTMITRNADEWPLGPAVRLPSHDEVVATSDLQDRRSPREQRPSSASAQEQRSQISQEELLADEARMNSSSRSGRWFLLLVLLLGLGIGGYSLLNPNLFAQIASYLGLAEAGPDALEHVATARELIQKSTSSAFEEANKKLDLAQQQTGRPFAALLATQASIQLIQMDLLRIRFRLLDKKLNHWQKQHDHWKNNTPSSSTENDPDDDPKTSPSSTVVTPSVDASIKPEQLKKLADILQRWKELKEHWENTYKEHWKKANIFLSQARQYSDKHPHTQLAALHQHIFPLDTKDTAAKTAQDKKFLEDMKRIQQQFDDRQVQGWLALQYASFLLHRGRYTESLVQAKRAIRDSGKKHWLYPRFLQALSRLELNEIQKTNALLIEIDKYAAEHPLVLEFREVIAPPSSLSTLLESHAKIPVAMKEQHPPTTHQPPKPSRPVVVASTHATNQASNPSNPSNPSNTTGASHGSTGQPRPTQRLPANPKTVGTHLSDTSKTATGSSPAKTRETAIPPISKTPTPSVSQPLPRKVKTASGPRKPKGTGSRSLLLQAYRACEQGGLGQKKQGLRTAQEMLRRTPDGFGYSTAGWCHFYLKQHTQAIGMFQKALNHKSTRPDTYYGMALAQVGLKQTKQACTSLRHQLRRFPRYSDNFEVRALIKKYECQ